MVDYYTGDEHYGHDEVIFHCGRPYKSNQRMVRDIIKRHNEVVKDGDTVHHLGDFCFAGPDRATYVQHILQRLNGTHILILGNHDQISALKYVDVGFRTVHTALELTIEGHHVVLAHDPSIWNVVDYKNTIFLCGHIHNLFRSIPDKRIVNVGVDVWDFYPITFAQILNELEI